MLSLRVLNIIQGGFKVASTLKLLPVGVSGTVITLLSACGSPGSGAGDSGNSGITVTTYQVSATAGTGGTITLASATVDAGGATTATVTPKSGYVVSSVTGCGGTLAGNTYTTGTISGACTVTAAFEATFTWVGGSNTPDAPAVYGTLGAASAANVPGARDGGTTWTDASGNLWLFGGFAGYSDPQNTTLAGNFLSDLWKYSLSSGQWTWVAGPTTVCSPPVYGTQGVAAATNTPGARTTGVKWIDAQGNLWLYGGGGCDPNDNFEFYGDLWEFSSSSGQWTWVNDCGLRHPRRGSQRQHAGHPPGFGLVDGCQRQLLAVWW
jgi:hypothetical protein